jgi:uncharacterized protein (TIGR03437 family)
MAVRNGTSLAVAIVVTLLPSIGRAQSQKCQGLQFFGANQLVSNSYSSALVFVRPPGVAWYSATANTFPPFTASTPSDSGTSILTGCEAVSPPSISAPADYSAGMGAQRAAAIYSADHSNIGLAALFYRQPKVLSVWKSDAGGNISGPVNITLPISAEGVLAADFNGDGFPDLAVVGGGDTAATATTVLIFLNDGKVSFGTPVRYDLAPGSTFRMAAGDFNRDGKVDLAATVENGSTGKVQILTGNGDGTFTLGALFAAGTMAGGIASADIDGDHKTDLVVSDSQGNAVSFYRGNGDGTFQAAVKIMDTGGPGYVAIGDFNHDGRPDVAVANYMANAVSVALNNGGAVFQQPRLYAITYSPESLIVTDANLDGHQDLVAGIGSPDAIGPGVNSAAIGVLLNLGDGNFQGAPMLPVGAQAANTVVAGDFDHDGKIDLAVSSAGTDTVTVLYGDAAVQFASRTVIDLRALGQTVGAGPMASADFNGDGRADLAVGGTGGQRVVVATSQSGRAFHTQSIAIPNYVAGIAAADLNGDGKPDLFATMYTGSSTADGASGYAVILNDGKGTFTSAKTATGINGTAVALGDLNGDGKADAVVGNYSVFGSNGPDPAGLSVNFGKGDGTFTPGQTYLKGVAAVNYVTIGDVDGDGKPDVAGVGQGPNYVWIVGVLISNGDGTFRDPVILQTDFGPSSVAIADYNGDGKADLIVSHCCGDTDMTYFLGNGDGSFQPEKHFSGGPGPQSIASADFDGDGKPDIAVASATYPSYVTVLRNVSATPPPLLTNVSAATFKPGPAAPDTIVTGFGANLAAERADATTQPLPTVLGTTSVSIHDASGIDTAAQLTTVTPGQVNYIVPAAVALGDATVSVTRDGNVVAAGPLTIDSVAPSVFVFNSAGLVAGSGLRVSGRSQTPFEIYQIDPATQAVVAAPIDLGGTEDQVYLILYATGIRHVSSSSKVTATVGGAAAQVAYAGPQGGFVGLDQINLVLSQSLRGKGSVPIAISVDGQAANVVNVTIQ